MKKQSKYFRMIPVYMIVLSCFLLVGVGGNRLITVWSETAPIPARKTVVIDAGHGGVDGGATSCTGVLESQINLEIALRLDDLMHLLGINTSMIRKSDISVYTSGETIGAKKVSDLKERVRHINDSQAAVVVSIHQNYFSDSRYSGSQVFYPVTPGSDQLARDMQQALSGHLEQRETRQAKKASGVYLMEHIQIPGVLIECGFLSNPEEEALLLDNTYQQKLCCVIAATISGYLANT